jgi:hypothetical protein
VDPDRAAQADTAAAPPEPAPRPWDQRLRDELVAAAVRQHERRSCDRRR